jgi:hypothetical protein
LLSTFKVANAWPTDMPDNSFLKEFQQLAIISMQAQQHDPMEVDLYQPRIKLSVLKTREHDGLQ